MEARDRDLWGGMRDQRKGESRALVPFTTKYFHPANLIIGICTKSRDFGTFLSLLDP